MTKIEERAIKAGGWREVRRIKQGTCGQCGGDIVMLWGTVVTGPGGKPMLLGALRTKEEKTVNHGPVCEKCGILYSPFVVKS